jgi:hypothetical protein
MATRMVMRNPAHQIFIIQVMYYAQIFESVVSVYLAMWDVRGKKKNIPMHIMRMVFTFLETVFGSGAIRLTSWILWMIGKFFG